MENLKLLVVGDGGVGKSCLLITYTTNAFPSEYVPTVFDNYSANVMHEGKAYNLGLWDTAGQEDYDRLRPLAYPQTDIALICFDLSNRSSLENVGSKWLPELKHYIPAVPVLLVGCKNDLRSPGRDSVVSYDEAKSYAKKLNLHYVETSSMSQDGIQHCFTTALTLAVAGLGNRRTKKMKGFGFVFSSKKKDNTPLPPVMPPAGKAPWLEVETSIFAEDWQKALEAPQHSDVLFIVNKSLRLNAHKIILCSASQFFARVIGITDSAENNQLKKIEKEKLYTREEVDSGQVPGIEAVHDERTADKTGTQTVITLKEEVKGKHFVHVLEFLYTGVPKFEHDISEEDLDNLINVSRLFNLSQLETICVNHKNEEEFLNPSIGTYLNDETGKRMKELFFNKPLLSDVVFKVNGTRIYGHKVVVSTRCQVMAAMFGGNFKEGKEPVTEVEIFDTTPENFLALLEYFYTDHSPIEDSDSTGILVLSNQYCQTRLTNLCELYITKEVDKHCQKNIEKSDIDVIGLLLMAQYYNATQLSDWCRHFISTNYEVFTKRQEFPLLKDENLTFIQENRWPPLSYLEEVDEYEKAMKKRGESCVIQ